MNVKLAKKCVDFSNHPKNQEQSGYSDFYRCMYPVISLSLCLTSVRACSCPSWTHTPINLEGQKTNTWHNQKQTSHSSSRRQTRPTPGIWSVSSNKDAALRWVYGVLRCSIQHFSYLSMLGCDSLFMSWTSLSMLARLLARMFIFRAMTWPDTRCCTCTAKPKKEEKRKREDMNGSTCMIHKF